MRSMLFVLLAAFAAPVVGQEVSVLVQTPPAKVVVSAQAHAEQLAATGSFAHCGRRGGGYEGIGFSTVSPAAAIRRSCFWSVRRVREIGTAWCPHRRGWVAVVRYY